MVFSRFRRSLIVIVAVLAGPAALAQSSPGYFIPPSGGGGGGGAPAAPGVTHHAHKVAQPPASALPVLPPNAGTGVSAGSGTADPTSQPSQAQLPAIPQLPALPKGTAPPTANVGVLSVPEVMQKSTAAQGVQAIIRDRQQALGLEAQKARAKIQGEQAKIVAQRAKFSDAQLEAKEKSLQDEVAATQADFERRNQAIQNSGQAALGQIESELIAVIRQVAEAHGMNLVLHREQVALNVNAFDITSDVAAQLNKLLPSVPVPPSVVTPGMVVNTQDTEDQSGGP